MGRNDDDFEDFILFKTVTGGGGCLLSVLSVAGLITMTAFLLL